MKKYVIKKDFPSSRIGDVWVEEDNGFMSPSGRESIKMHKHLFTSFDDWFDEYGELKEYWFINDLDGEPMKCELRGSQFRDFSEWNEKRKQIGNYFETKEEAEKAVKKLRAWKLLKDECNIKFNGIIRDNKGMLKAVKLSYDRHTVTFDRMRECMDALRLLFGGEE